MKIKTGLVKRLGELSFGYWFCFALICYYPLTYVLGLVVLALPLPPSLWVHPIESNNYVVNMIIVGSIAWLYLCSIVFFTAITFFVIKRVCSDFVYVITGKERRDIDHGLNQRDIEGG